jgi:hypothetical protein
MVFLELNGRLTLVASKYDVRVLEKMCSQDVGKGMIFFVECEYRAICSSCDQSATALRN